MPKNPSFENVFTAQSILNKSHDTQINIHTSCHHHACCGCFYYFLLSNWLISLELRQK